MPTKQSTHHPYRSAFDRALHKSGKTGKTLASQLGVSQSEVSRWRNGLIPTDKEFRKRVALKLRTSQKELGWN